MQVPRRRPGAAAAANASQISGSGIGVSGSAGTLPSAVYGYADSIDVGMMTCSPPHNDSNPAADATRQTSSESSCSWAMLLANANPNFMWFPDRARVDGQPVRRERS